MFRRPRKPVHRRASPRASQSPSRRRRWPLLAALSFIAVVLLVIALLASPGRSSERSDSAAALPSGPARAGVVEAPEPVLDLGRVPLDTVVQPSFLLRNVGGERAHFGQPSVEVVEGC